MVGFPTLVNLHIQQLSCPIAQENGASWEAATWTVKPARAAGERTGVRESIGHRQNRQVATRQSNSRTLAPGTEHQPTKGKGNERATHVNENKRPRICFKSGECGDGGVINKEKCEPADERDG